MRGACLLPASRLLVVSPVGGHFYGHYSTWGRLYESKASSRPSADRERDRRATGRIPHATAAPSRFRMAISARTQVREATGLDQAPPASP